MPDPVVSLPLASLVIYAVIYGFYVERRFGLIHNKKTKLEKDFFYLKQQVEYEIEHNKKLFEKIFFTLENIEKNTNSIKSDILILKYKSGINNKK